MAIDFNKFGKSTDQQATSTRQVSSYPSTSVPQRTGGIDFNKFGKSAEQTKKVEKKPYVGYGPVGLGRALDYSLRGAGNVAKIEKGVSGITTAQQEILKRIQDRKARGEDYSHLLKGLEGSSAALAELGGLADDAATGGMKTRDVIGSALETASLLPVSAAATVGKNLIGGKVVQGGVQAAKEGLFSGAAGFAGSGLKDAPRDATTGELVKGAVEDAVTGAVIGATTGFGIGAGIPLVGKGASKLFKGGSKYAKEVGETKSLTKPIKEAAGERYRKVEANYFDKPGQEGGSKFKKAGEIYRNAKSRNNNLGELAVNEGIKYDDLVEDGVYKTTGARDIVRDKTIKLQREVLRPALESYKYGVQKVPVEDVRIGMLAEVDNLPDSVATAADKDLMKRNINKEFGPNSPEARKFSDGYDLVNLLDSKVARDSKGKYIPGGSSSDNFNATLARRQAKVFRRILERNAPKELDIKTFNKELGNRFELADYIESLDGKKAPKGVVQKTMQFAGKGLGAIAGTQAGGGLGGFAGYHIGGNILDWISNMPNPVRNAFLQNMEKQSPEVFQAFKNAIGAEDMRRLKTPLLPASGQSSYKDPGRRFFVTPKGTATQVRQEASDLAAVETKNARQPKAGPSKRAKIKDMLITAKESALEPYATPAEMKQIKMGKIPKRLKDIYDNLPTIEY